ncbi:MAG: YlxR family protein [Lachnospiraceae bacterium]|nr:YlxR family protein [Lachnospiraceae bacterium]
MTMNKKVPMRKCVGCGEMKEKKSLIRIIHTPEDTLVLDHTGKKNGRGAYICPGQECLERAEKTKGIERSLKTNIPASIYEQLKKEMQRIETG